MKTEVKTKYPEFDALVEAEKNVLMKIWAGLVNANFFQDSISESGDDMDFWSDVITFLPPDLKIALEVGEGMLRTVDCEKDTPVTLVPFVIHMAHEKINSSSGLDEYRYKRMTSYILEMVKFMDEYHRETLKSFNN